jgi:hypothetical protein
VGHFTAHAVFSLKISYLKTYEISLHVAFSCAHYGRNVIMRNVFIYSTGELISVKEIYTHLTAQDLNRRSIYHALTMPNPVTILLHV